MCALRDESYEDAVQVFLDCPRARNIWRDGHLLSKVNSTMHNNNTTDQIIFALLQDQLQVQDEQFVTIVRILWI